MPQCKVFWPLQLHSEFLGVPEDSQVPFSGVWVVSSHFPQSGVATKSEFLGEKPQITKKEYEDVSKKKTSINKKYEVKPLFYAKSLGWRGKNFYLINYVD